MNLARLHVCLPTYVNSDLLKESFKKEKLRELSIKTKKYGNRDQWKENHSTENSRKFRRKVKWDRYSRNEILIYFAKSSSFRETGKCCSTFHRIFLEIQSEFFFLYRMCPWNKKSFLSYNLFC